MLLLRRYGQEFQFVGHDDKPTVSVVLEDKVENCVVDTSQSLLTCSTYLDVGDASREHITEHCQAMTSVLQSFPKYRKKDSDDEANPSF